MRYSEAWRDVGDAAAARARIDSNGGIEEPAIAPEGDVLDWDAALEAVPPRPSGTLKVHLVHVETPPFSVGDTADGAVEPGGTSV